MKLHRDRLASGLEVCHLEDPEATASCIQVWYRVGSSLEDPDKRGIAHLLEHMMFKGTRTVEPEEHARIVQRLGGTSNAYTTEDVTVYYETLPAEHFEKALELEADRMVNLSFPPDHFEKERNVVIEEHAERILNQPATLAFQKVRLALFDGHPYAVDAAGIPDQIRAFTREDLKDFYRAHYHPGNAALVTCGPQPGEKMLEASSRHFGSIPANGERSELPPPLPSDPPARVETPSPIKLHMTARVMMLSRSKESYHARNLLNLLLGDGESSVLKLRIERRKRAVLNAGTYYHPTAAGDLFFAFAGILPFPGLNRAIRAIDKILGGPIPFADEDLERVKGRVRIALQSDFYGAAKRASRLGGYAVLRDDPEAIFTDDAAYAATTLTDVAEQFERIRNARSSLVLMRASWLPGRS